jgi:hypothetical protein
MSPVTLMYADSSWGHEWVGVLVTRDFAGKSHGALRTVTSKGYLLMERFHDAISVVALSMWLPCARCPKPAVADPRIAYCCFPVLCGGFVYLQ